MWGQRRREGRGVGDIEEKNGISRSHGGWCKLRIVEQPPFRGGFVGGEETRALQ